MGDGFKRLSGVELGGEQEAEGFVQSLEAGFSEAATLQADLVHAEGFVFAACAGEREGEDVLRDDGASADVSVAANVAELVDGAEGADSSEVFNDDVAGEGGAIGEDHLVADMAIVADVRIRHQQTIAAEGGEAAAFFSAATDSDTLADSVVVAYCSAGGFAVILEILRGDANGGEGKEGIACADFCVAVDDDMRDEIAIFAERDFRADGAEGTDGAGGGNVRSWCDDGAGVDAH